MDTLLRMIYGKQYRRQQHDRDECTMEKGCQNIGLGQENEDLRVINEAQEKNDYPGTH